MHSLTVFIGENDSGKTTIVRALQLLMTSIAISNNDFHQSESGEVASQINLEAVFSVGLDDNDGGFSTILDGDRIIKIQKVYNRSSRSSCRVLKEIYSDHRFNNFTSLSAEDIKNLMRDIGLTVERTKADNVATLARHLETSILPKSSGWQDINFSDVEAFLPQYHPILSTDYKDPSSMIQNSMQTSLNTKIRSISDESHPLYSTVKGFEEWIDKEIDEESSSIPQHIRASLPNIRDVKVATRLDLSRMVTVSSVSIDTGRGLRPIDTYGEGTRKKLWMSLMDWNQQLNIQSEITRPIIRVYDEPDLNLDYAAEKRLFDYISNSSKDQNSKIQNVLCTHSATLIDRAPVESINLISVGEDDVRKITYLRQSDHRAVEGHIKSFFDDIGSHLKIRNTELFYEKGYFVFEGETEEELIPILYQTLFGKNAEEDGIVFVNMHTCSSWRSTLEFLGKNRADRTVMLLDKDSTFPDSSARITEEALRRLNFNDGIFLVGEKELEDAFDNDVIARAMHVTFPREDGYQWVARHIQIIREIPAEKPKFSEDLKNYIKTYCEKEMRREVRKTSIGKAIALTCKNNEIPSEIEAALREIRRKIGLIE